MNPVQAMQPAAERPRFQRVQEAFTRHIRDPRAAPAPEGVEDRRMGIYRELLYNNVESFMASGFPVLRKVCSDAQWHGIMRDYFRSHRARTPYYPKMSSEFLRYLEQERGACDGDPAFLLELAHYEWIETTLMFDTRRPEADGVDRDGDLLDGAPVLSPLALPLAYRFPVHRIGPDFIPAEPPPQPTYLVVYRDRDDRIGFLELNAVSARLLDLLRQGEARSGHELLRQIARELGHPDPAVVERGGADILSELRRRDVILGTRCAA
jgi:hypothetical protein